MRAVHPVPLADHHYERMVYAAYPRTPGENPVREVTQTVTARALYEGDEESVHIRVAGDVGAGEVFLDLADEDWRVVRVDAAGWELLDTSPVRFTRKGASRPLPVPEHRPGALDDLRTLVNLEDDQAWTLLVSWLVGVLHPKGSFPLLILHGEQGSAKSTLARMVQSLMDPVVPLLRSPPRTERDLMIAAQGGWLLTFDNLSSLTPDLSDSLCRLATGGGFATRMLYTDDEEKVFDASRPVVMNGISQLVYREDLASRAIILSLPAIPEKGRRTEAEIDRRFEEIRSGVLGALLDAVSTALQRLPEVCLPTTPRMADFATWVVAAEAALPWEPGTFLESYRENQLDIICAAIDSSYVVAAVQALVKSEGVFEGNAMQLLHTLNEVAEDDTKRSKAWPRTPRGLTNQLNRALPLFRELGLDVTHTRETTGERRRLIRISPSPADDEPLIAKIDTGKERAAE